MSFFFLLTGDLRLCSKSELPDSLLCLSLCFNPARPEGSILRSTENWLRKKMINVFFVYMSPLCKILDEIRVTELCSAGMRHFCDL